MQSYVNNNLHVSTLQMYIILIIRVIGSTHVSVRKLIQLTSVGGKLFNLFIV
jgi:hypothetical protein